MTNIPPSLQTFGQFFAKGNPFLASIGVELLHAGNGEAELTLTLRPDHMNSWHVTHGGVSMTLIDVAMALAGRTLSPTAQSCVTVDMNTRFLQPGGKPGDRLVVKAKAFHRSATLCFCEAEIRNGRDLVVHGTGTFKYLKQLDKLGKLTAPSGNGDA
ncbi:MAG: PaaI family thioesterase [Herbaspirillum sp.]|nr:PaaI family thioesterase [Herbaspirillum sp.]